MGARSIALFLLSLGVFGGGLSYYIKQKKEGGSDLQSVAGSLFMPGVKKAQENGAAGGEAGASAGVAPEVRQAGGAAIEAMTKIGSGISGKRAETLRSSGVGDLLPSATAPAAVAKAESVVPANSSRGEEAARIAALERENQALCAELTTLRKLAAQRKTEPVHVAADTGELRTLREQCAELEKQKKLISGELAAVRAEFAAAFAESLQRLGKNDDALRKRALAYQKLNERREKEFAQLTQEYKLQAEQLRTEVEQLEQRLALVKPKSRKP